MPPQDQQPTVVQPNVPPPQTVVPPTVGIQQGTEQLPKTEAIVGIVLAVLLPIVGIPFCIFVLYRIKHGKTGGKTLAIVGLCIGIIFLLSVLLFFAFLYLLTNALASSGL